MRFLENVALCIKELNVPMDHLTVVLPSERATKYLSDALYKVYQKPLIAPEITTMDRWVKSHEPLTVIDRTRALLKLFEIQLEDAKSVEDLSFEEFMNWGPLLLNDFDEIDRYSVAVDQIFKNLRDIQEIEMWSFDQKELTPSQQRFLEFWERLPRYYKRLNAKLELDNCCYAGKAYRNLADDIERIFKKDKEHHVVFAGFNALSGAERSVMKQLDTMGRATVLVDADHFYVENKHHEAGFFIRNLQSTLQRTQLDFTQNTLKSKKMHLLEIECPQKTGQVKAASGLLSELSKEQLDEALVLLADESLIDSMIRNIPKNVGTANITLGLPIRNTAARTWIELIYSIQENKQRFKTQAIYHKDVLQLWHHPFYIALLSNAQREKIASDELDMIRKNKIFLNADKLVLSDELKLLVEYLTDDWKGDWLKSLNAFQAINRILYSRLTEEQAFDKAAIAAFDKAVIGFKNIVEEGIPEMSFRSFKQLFFQHWSNQRIAYQGNPIEGLQIMGLLETRTLDFKRIICLGMNEGNLPSTNPMQTLIPMDLRRAFDLPTSREKQGLFAHHFYRLLHQCEDLTISYFNADEGMGNNEPSRYLLQLKMELETKESNIEHEKVVYTLEDSGSKEEHLITKTPEILERIQELLEGSCSASMLKTYLSCPLDFYYKYVLEFREGETIEEEIESNQFGTFIHDTLEELYSDFARITKDGVERKVQPLTSLDIEKMLKVYPIVLEEKFLKYFGSKREAFTTGKNLLSFEMAKKLTGQFLKSELEFVSQLKEPLFIESLEREYSTSVTCNVNGNELKVNLRGKIDRIDNIGDKVRIIDYKTGKVTDTNVQTRKGDSTIEDVAGSMANSSYKHLLQLVQYAYLYYQEHKIIPESSIISFISNKNQPFPLSSNMDIEEIVKGYPKIVEMFVQSMLDQGKDFNHEGGEYSYCAYCE